LPLSNHNDTPSIVSEDIILKQIVFWDMPQENPEAIREIIEDTRMKGIFCASKMVLENRYGSAKDVFAKVLELCPNDVEVMSLYANVFIYEGKLLEAENRLNQVLTLNPDYPLALFFLGVVYHDKQEYERAVHMYELALKHFPEDKKEEIADVYQNLGCSLYELKKREEALEAWRTCLKYNPEQNYAKEHIETCTNEYGMTKSPVGMDDFWAFVDFKRKEYLSVKGRDYFKGIDEANVVLKKIAGAWNDKILPKWGSKLKRMKIKDKVKLFEETTVFE
jgi:tetratricopeptide (TPR) repeat protein